MDIYKISYSRRTSNSGWSADEILEGKEEVAKYLFKLLWDSAATFNRIRLERFDGGKWVKAKLELVPLTVKIDGNHIYKEWEKFSLFENEK